MIELLKRRRERKTWEGRVRRQVDGLLVEEKARLELPLAGPPERREELLALYRRLLEPVGYRVATLVKSPEVWTLEFEMDGTSDRSNGEGGES